MIAASVGAIGRLRRGAVLWGLLGLVGAGLCALGFRADPPGFFRAYLPACLFWTGISLGSLALIMVHHLTGGRWGVFAHPILKAAAGLLPLLALVFVPLAFGLDDLYAWVNPTAELADTVRNKAAYLNVPFFLGRSGAEFVIWIGLAAALGAWSRTPLEELEPARRRRYRGWSAAGLILFGLSVTVFAIDWVMSLEPRWYSTNFGLLAGTGPLVAALAFAVLVSAALTRTGTPAGEVACARLQDLGNLLLAGIMLWTYLAFNQYLTIWSENLPDKILWYLRRRQDIWPGVALLLLACHFLLPFLALLSRRVKRSPAALLGIAALVLLGRLLDTYWLVMPTFEGQEAVLEWLTPAAVIGVGGIWLALFCWSLSRLLPAAPDAPAASRPEALHHG